jgi:hypothetical protein
MSKKHFITTIETCQECHGEARIYAPFCRRCLRDYSSEELIAAQGAESMPCGHAWRDLEEELYCIECQGSGEVRTITSLADALQDLDCFQFLQERMENAEQWIIALNDALTEAHHQKIIESCGLADGFVTDDDGNLVEGLVSAE